MKLQRLEGTKKFKCPYCDKEFMTSVFVFKDHIDRNHKGMKVLMTNKGEFIKDQGQTHKEHHIQRDHLKC